MKITDYEVDPMKLDGGVWWSISRRETCKDNKPAAGQGCFKVVPLLGNTGFARAMEDGLITHAGTLRDKDTSEETKADIRRRISAEAFADNALLEIAGFDDVTTFDRAKKLEFLTERRWEFVAQFLWTAANDSRAALAREEEQARGN